MSSDHFNWLAWSGTRNLRHQGGCNVNPRVPERNEGCLVFVNYFSRVCSFVWLTAYHQSNNMGKDSGWLSEKIKRNYGEKNLSPNVPCVFAMPTFTHIVLRSCLCPPGVEPVNFWEKEDHRVPAAGPRAEGECLNWLLCRYLVRVTFIHASSSPSIHPPWMHTCIYLS